LEVILKQDVPNLGKKGEAVNVKDGYARNFLFPRNLAVPATKGTLRLQESLQEAKQEKEERLLALAQKAGEAI